MAVSRSWSSRSTAMSASVTGEDSPLVQLLSGVRNIESASAPASRTLAASRAAVCVRSATSVAGNSQTLHPQCRCIGAIAEAEIVGRRQAAEHFQEVAGNRHFADRIGARAVLDPEPGSAAAVIAGDLIDAHADQVGDIEAVLDVGDELLRAQRAGREMQVARPGRRRRGDAALGMAGGLEAEF